MQTDPVVWFEIYVQEMARAKRFYEAVFQYSLTPLPGPGLDIDMLAFPAAMGRPGAAGALVKMAGFPSGGNSTIVYFCSADCAIEASRAVAAGGRVEREKMSIGEYGFIALLVDSEGNMIGVHSMA